MNISFVTRFILFSSLLLCVYVSCMCHVCDREQLGRVNSLLLAVHEFQGSNLDCPAYTVSTFTNWTSTVYVYIYIHMPYMYTYTHIYMYICHIYICHICICHIYVYIYMYTCVCVYQTSPKQDWPSACQWPEKGHANNLQFPVLLCGSSKACNLGRAVGPLGGRK